MSEVVSSATVVALFLLLATATFLLQIDLWTTYSLEGKATANRRAERLHTNMDITSVTQSATGCGTFSATVGNARAGHRSATSPRWMS